jgi:hypothetical protein
MAPSGRVGTFIRLKIVQTRPESLSLFLTMKASVASWNCKPGCARDGRTPQIESGADRFGNPVWTRDCKPVNFFPQEYDDKTPTKLPLT